MAREGQITVHSENMFPIIKKWLYSDKDIFLRELVANACDAISKRQRLESLGATLSVTDEARELLTRKGYDPDYGARPLRRTIRTQVEDPCAQLLLEGGLPQGSVLTVTVQEGKLALLPSPAALALREET